MTDGPAVARVLYALAAQGKRFKKTAGRYQCQCPAHDDKRASLTLSQGETGAVLHCHAGCTPEQIVAALGLTMAELFDDWKGGGKGGSEVVAEYVYTSADGRPLHGVARYFPKKFAQFRFAANGDRVWDMNGVERVPYHLPEVLEAIEAGDFVFPTEGEKDVETLRGRGICATTFVGGCGGGKHLDQYAPYFEGANVVVLPDHDKPGEQYAQQIARAFYGTAASVRVLPLPGLKKGQDVSDWLKLCNGTKDELLRLASAVEEWEPEPNTKPVLRVIDGGAPATPAKTRAATPKQDGNAPWETDPEPFDGHVGGAELLDSLSAGVRRFLVLPDGGADLLALWTIHSHAHDASEISPFLAITSPTMRCGKTTVLQVLLRLVRRPMTASNVTPSTIFRAVDQYGPTLLFDEMDSFIDSNEELRGVLNSGHTRDTAFISRTVPVGRGHEPKSFRTWAPRALALIGSLPPTLADRSIEIRMERKKKGDSVERARKRALDTLVPLASMSWTWAQANLEALRVADPAIPAELDDRQQDNWQSLLAIADLADGDWPERARAAARALVADRVEDAERGIAMLRFLKKALERHGNPLPTRILLDELRRDDNAPVAPQGREWSPQGVAALLRPFGIRPHRMSRTLTGGVRDRGYHLEDCEAEFARYCPTPPGSSHRPKSGNTLARNDLGWDDLGVGQRDDLDRGSHQGEDIAPEDLF